MDSNIMQFVFNGQQVRIVIIEGEPWFTVRDLCEVLGIRNPNATASKVLKLERKRYYNLPIYIVDTKVEEGIRPVLRKMLLTDESGMYRIVLRSYKPEAQEFQHWITSEVLPSIRQTGSYEFIQKNKEVLSFGVENNLSSLSSQLKISLLISGDVKELRDILKKLVVNE